MKRTMLFLTAAAAIAMVSISVPASAGSVFSSGTGLWLSVPDVNVPNGPKWEGGTAIGRDWATTKPYDDEAAMFRQNIRDCCNGRRPKQTDANGNMGTF